MDRLLTEWQGGKRLGWKSGAMIIVCDPGKSPACFGFDVRVKRLALPLPSLLDLVL